MLLVLVPCVIRLIRCTHRMIWVVSTKCLNKPERPCGIVRTPPFIPFATTLTATWVSLNKLDCSLVFTTSNGLVTMAPAMPPILAKNGATKGVRILTLSTNESKTHAPPTKCCQDFAGTHFDCAVSDIGNLTVRWHGSREGGRFVGHVIRTLNSDDRVVPWQRRGPDTGQRGEPRQL